jgi:hypothetical protein
MYSFAYYEATRNQTKELLFPKRILILQTFKGGTLDSKGGTWRWYTASRALFFLIPMLRDFSVPPAKCLDSTLN